MPSRYCASVNHWRRSTRSRCMAATSATGPPKPVAPSSRKYRASGPGSGRAGSFLIEGVEIGEDRGAAVEALLIVAGGKSDGSDEARHAAGLRTSELLVLEVNVMDDFGDCLERAVLHAEAAEQ